MLKNYQNMFYVEPVFQNPIRHYHGKNGYGYDFAVIVEHDGKNINLVTMKFRSRSDKNDCFGCEHYIGHKVACLYDPINNPHYLYVIRRVD